MKSKCSSSHGHNDDSRPSALPESRNKGNGTDIFTSKATEGPKCSSGFSKQNDECDVDSNDVLEDVRLLWVDDPDPTYFKSHRALKRYARELKMITDVMREYSGRQEDNNQLLLDKTLEYGLRAHGIYNNALHQWLEDNPEAHSRPLVQNLVKEYREKESEDLKRYYDRASRKPECRSKPTVRSSTGTASKSSFSEQSMRIIQEQQKEISELKMQSKMQALTIQEKEIEVQRTNIELERKSLQLNTYQQIDDQFENATDAAELGLAGLKSNKDHFLHDKEEVKMKSEFPETTPGNVSPETTPKNIDVIEAPPMPVEC